MQIVKTPAPVLTQKAEPVKNFDKKLKKLVDQMIETLAAARNPEGVGLAAPQVGISKRIFIAQTNVNQTKTPPRFEAFINPEIIESSKIRETKPTNFLEGCLSIDNIWGFPEREIRLKLRYQDLDGQIKTRSFSGPPAIIVQHEMDHLNGILFTQRVLKQNGKLYKIKKYSKKGEPVIEPIKI